MTPFYGVAFSWRGSVPTSRFQSIRRWFVVAVAVMMLVLAGLSYWHGSREAQTVSFGNDPAIGVLLFIFIMVLLYLLSWLFLKQLHKLEQFHLKMMEQQDDLALRAELLDAASDAILLVDEQGSFIYFNRALQTMTGYDRDELLQRGLYGIKPPEDVTNVRDIIRTVMHQGEGVFDSAYAQKSGGILPVEVHTKVTNVNGRACVLSVARDVSVHKAVEQKLSLVAMEWRDTFDAVEDAVLLLDMDRRVVRANKATQKLLGKAPQDIIGTQCCAVVHDGAKKIESCPFHRMVTTGKRASVVMTTAHQWFEVSVDPVFSKEGTLTHAVHIVKDITNLKKSEHREQIRSVILERIACGEPLSQLLTFIIVSIERQHPEMICSIMQVSDDGRFLTGSVAPSLPDFYNRATNRTKIGEGIGTCGTAAFRRERVIVEDITGHPFWNTFSPAAEAGLRSCWSEPIISSTGTLLGTFAIYHRTPETPGAEEIALIQQASVFAGIAIERSKGEAKRVELEHLLNQSQKMEAIGHLAGGIAHDFNNLLTPILIYAEMLKRSVPGNEKVNSQLDGIIKASGKARDLAQQLLSFGRKQVMHMQVVDLNGIIASFYTMVRRTLRENIGFNLQLSSQPVVVRADSTKIEQALLNLVLNAQDAIEGNGSIVIETGHVLVDDEFSSRHPGIAPGSYVLLSCADDGCGMAPETTARIFEPFFSTKESGRGTGLGLANVYGIVKQHNGCILAASTVGTGTTFRIYLPVCTENPDSFEVERESADTDHPSGGVILLVEDNEMFRVMLHELLEGLGHAVYSAEHPARALELVQEIPERIDLVITDVVMPGMNGPQLFAKISEDHPEIDRVLYMSGYTDNVFGTAADLSEGGLCFLQKPFTIDTFVGKVRELLAPVNR